MAEVQARLRQFDAHAETVMGDTIVRVADIHERLKGIEIQLALLPEIKIMVSTAATVQSTMAQSAQSMADTFKRAEDRYQRMEERYVRMEERQQELVNISNKKEQIPLKSHYWIIVSALLPSVIVLGLLVLGVLWFTKQDLKVSLKELELKQQKTNELVNSSRDSTKEVVENATKKILNDDTHGN